MSVVENQLAPDIGPAPERAYPFEFRGTASEYFGIWIVNVLLSIVTLGIYSAWAKVRRLRYFYGNTYLDGLNFEYWARPGQILIGRLLVFIGFLVFNGLTMLSPYFYSLLIPFLFALPWLINTSIAFNARMTSYRNLRLSFTGSYWRGFWVYVCLPALAILTLGVLAPVAARARWTYMAQNLRYGGAQFSAAPQLWPLYKNLFATFGFALAFAAPIGFVIIFLLVKGAKKASLSDIIFLQSIFLITGLVVVLFIGFIGVFYRTGVRNICFNALRLGDASRFESSMGRFAFTGIAITNVLVIVLTFGLMRPWAAVRSWRYIAVNTAVVTARSFDDFVGAASADGNVAAAEFTAFQGVDLGF